MKLTIDTTTQTLVQDTGTEQHTIALHSKAAFELISQLWLKVGWGQRYSYTFSWMGRPIIQLPEDLLRIQEVIYQVKPDVIVETGVAHGGSLIFYASLCKALQKGRIIGVDIEIRPHNRVAIEQHELFPYITLVEGSSTAPEVVAAVEALIQTGETVLVILDSLHTKQHVLDELQAYHTLVTEGAYIVATDGIMRELYDVPGGQAEWNWDNPAAAADEFARQHPEFVLEQPPWPFNESDLSENVTHWPGAWLRRRSSAV
jgi:cephalosporin hydroxylase